MDYYKKVEIEEHMIYADEILEIFSKQLPESTTPNKIHSIIAKYCKDYGKENPQLYYSGRNGLKKVYSKDLWYPAMVRYTMVLND